MLRSRPFRLAALLLAFAGYWLPWLTHPAAALRLNGYELSEWVTFLPGVRDGSLAIARQFWLAPQVCLRGGSDAEAAARCVAASGRLSFLVPLACLALLCALVASRPGAASARTGAAAARPWQAMLPELAPGWGWGVLALGLLAGFVVLPPYPYLLRAYADGEFQSQLLIGLVALFGLWLALYLPAHLKDVLQIGLAALGGGLALWALLAVRPAASQVLNAPWPVGLGWWAMLAGFAALALSGLALLFGPRE